MSSGLVAEKLGMTQIYDEQGACVPVTVLRLLPNVVTAVRTLEKNGYGAVQLGYGTQKESRLNKPRLGYLKKNNLPIVNQLKEFRTDRAAEYKVGGKIGVSVFKAGDVLDISGHSKGKGFQGVMKRYHFSGGADSHGCSISHRVPGSIGNRTQPGRVMAGKKLPGQMGNANVTLKNLAVVAVEAEQNLLLVRGSVPGANSGCVFLFPKAKDFEDRVFKALATETAGAEAAS